MKKAFTLILVLLSFATGLQATHIVGGRVYYEHVDGNKYRIILKIYRDCYNGEAPFDDPAHVTVFKRSDNSFFTNIALSNPRISKVPVIVNDPCLSTPPNVCVEEGIYEAIVTLPNDPQGYLLVHQRCCRNKTIDNLVNPNEQGTTYYTTIPSVEIGVKNSSPEFKEWPPIAICANKKFVFDHSANDPDGDSLVYSFCPSLKGATISDPFPERADPPPYSPVPYDASRGFSSSYPVASSPKLKIDPETGIITGTPTVPGQYVVGICVEEYDDGKLIGKGFRDFQFNVTSCEKKVEALINVPPGDTSINNCDDFTVKFKNNSIGTNNFYWDFGVPGQTGDTSRAANPSFTFPDTGTYRVTLIAQPNGICADTDRVTVKVYPLLQADFSVLDTCPEDSLPLQDLTTNSYGNIEEWEWSFGDGLSSLKQNPVHQYKEGGNYIISLKVTNEYGCESRATNKVNIFPKPNSSFKVTEHCLQKPLKIEYLSTIDSGSITETNWHFGNGQTATGVVPQFSYENPGNYTILLVESSGQGCIDSAMQEVNIRPKTEAKVNGDTTICAQDAIQLFASGGFTYEWFPAGNYQRYVNNPFVYPEETTTYTVYVDDGCYMDTAQVTVSTKPKPTLQVSNDTTIHRKGNARLWAKSSADQFEWKPKYNLEKPFSSRTLAQPMETVIYEVFVTADNGCIESSKVRVEVVPECGKFYIPNAFTPNDDGTNDAFYPKNYGDAAVKEFSIYSRWGIQVYHSTTGEGGWDGVFNGQPMPNGTYIYDISVECGGKTLNYKGSVQLIR